MGENGLLGFFFVLLFIGLMIGFYFIGKRWPVALRPLSGYRALRNALECAVESGERVHLSLGTGELIGSESATAFAGLTVLARLASATAMSDKPIMVSAGDGALVVLAQDTLRTAYRRLDAESRYDATSARLIGPTPFSYAAGLPTFLDTEDVSAHLMIGPFGSEGALAASFGQQKKAFVLAGTQDVQSQALLYATSDHPLIGEEVFAAGAYLDMGPFHLASIRAQDVIRWILIALVLIGTLLKTVGVIR